MNLDLAVGRLLICASMLAPIGLALAAGPKLALIVPLSGGLAAAGKDIESNSRAWAAEQAARGTPVELMVLDDRSTADGAREAAQRAKAQGAVAVLNCFGSVSCVAIAEELAPAGLPLVGAIAGDERLRSAALPNVFTTRAGAADEVDAILKYVQGNWLGQVAVLYQDDGFGKSYKRTLDGLLAKRPGVRIVSATAIDPVQPDYAQAAKLATAEPSTAVLLLTNTRHSVALIEAMGKAGYRGMYFNLAAQANPVFVSEMARLTASHKLFGVFVTTTPNPAGSDSAADYRKVLARFDNQAKPSYLGYEAYINASLVGLVLQREARPSADSLARLLPTLKGARVGGLPINYDALRREVTRWLSLAVVTREGDVRAY
jgi:ABC-type branched-subunit amino acid transport system substrate-binding protein